MPEELNLSSNLLSNEELDDEVEAHLLNNDLLLDDNNLLDL